MGSFTNVDVNYIQSFLNEQFWIEEINYYFVELLVPETFTTVRVKYF